MKTQSAIPHNLMVKFTHFLEEATGLRFREDSWPLFNKKFLPAAKDFGFEEASPCMEWLMSAPLNDEQIAILAHHLTVGETYFFRDSHAFHVLKQHILPELIERKRRQDKQLRIWSAACCTGEEPYSIAMVLKSILPDIEDWQITILGTDINNNFLKLAASGEFREWSFRGMPTLMKQRYFSQLKSKKYAIDPTVKSMVQFSYLNLIEDSYPSLLNGTNAMDLILANNVLIYFSEETINRVMQKVANSLVNKGWLMVSPVEVPYIQNDYLHPRSYPEATIFQKQDERYQPVRFFEQKALDLPSLEFTSKEVATPKPSPKKIVPPQEKDQPFTLAIKAFDKGCYEEAIHLLEDQKVDANIADLLIKCYGNLGQLQDALKWCDHAISISKSDPKNYFLKATLYQELEEDSLAIDNLNKALYFDSNFIIAHMSIANLYLREGKLKDAKRHYRNALALLEKYGEEDSVPCSEGLTAGRIRDIINTMQGAGNG